MTAGRLPATVAWSAIGLGLAFRLYVIALPTEALTARYLADDYFYYLNVAFNIADGHGSSFDGGLTSTNGYQPLFLWLLAGVFALGATKTAVIHIGLMMQAIAAAGASAIAYRLLAARSLRWAGAMAAGLVSLNLFFVLPTVTGFEMALALLGAMLALWCWQSGRSAFVVGIASGCAVLARVDNLALVTALGLVLLLQRRPRDLLGLLLGVAVVTAPWTLWNVMQFGHPLQDSGVIKAHYRGLPAIWLSLSTAFSALPRILLPGRIVDAMIDVAPWLVWSLATVVLLVATRAAVKREHRTLALYGAALLSAYVLVIDPNEPGALVRYLFPAWAVLAILVAQMSSPFIVASVLLLHAADLALYVRWERTAPLPVSYVGVAHALAPAAIDKHVEPGMAVAAFDAGALGYFAPRPVVNLDGLANHDIVELRRTCRQPYPQCLGHYLTEKGIQILAGGTGFGWTNHFPDWPRWDRIYESPPLVDGSKLVILRIPRETGARE